MIKTFDRSKLISVKSNIFQPNKIDPQDVRGKKVNISEPLTQTFIFAHNQSNMPQVIKETYIPEEFKVDQEEEYKKQIKVVRTEDEERQRMQDQYDFENRIRLMLEKFNSEKRDAFDTASMLTEEMFKYKLMKTELLSSNRLAAKSRVSEKIMRDTQKEDEDNKKNKIEVKRLYRQIKEVVQHILEGGGESKYKRYQQSIESKDHITLEYIKEKQKTVEEIKSATDVMQLVRLFLSKKTEELDVYKQLHGEEFLTDPSILKDMSESQAGESASVASDKLSKVHEELKQSEEDQKLNKFYNLTDLKIQWGVKTEYEVKENIRRILTRDVLREAERAKVKQEIEEEEIKQRLIKNDPRFARMFREQQKKKQEKLRLEQEEREKKERIKQDKIKAQQKKRDQQELEQQKLAQTVRSKKPAPKQPKNPKREAENKVKREFFDTSSGVGLVYGDVFQRTKNFGDLFQQKAQEFYFQNQMGYPSQQSQMQQSTVDTFDGQSRFSQMEK